MRLREQIQMDWWQTAREVLGRPDHPSGQALRWGLEGLRGCLTAAVAQAPDDDVQRLLTGLDDLLAPGKPSPAPAPETSPAPSPSGLRFAALADEAGAAADLRAELGPLRLPRTSDAD